MGVKGCFMTNYDIEQLFNMRGYIKEDEFLNKTRFVLLKQVRARHDDRIYFNMGTIGGKYFFYKCENGVIYSEWGFLNEL
jgi:hypothetical protein